MNIFRIFVLLFLMTTNSYADLPKRKLGPIVAAHIVSCAQSLLGLSSTDSVLHERTRYPTPRELLEKRNTTISEIENIISIQNGSGNYVHILTTDADSKWIRVPQSNPSYGDLIGLAENSDSIELVTPESLRGKRILIMGCGHGRIIINMKNLGLDVYGHEAELSLWQKEIPMLFTEGQLDNTPYKDGQFDIVIALNSLYGMNKNISPINPALRAELKLNLIKELARNTKPNGKIIIAGADNSFLIPTNQLAKGDAPVISIDSVKGIQPDNDFIFMVLGISPNLKRKR